MYTNKNIEPDYNILAKHFAKETNYEEIKAIESWVSESADNKKSYDRMYYLWLQSSKQQHYNDINIETAWMKMQSRINQNTEKAVQEPAKTISIYRRTMYRFLQLAAIVIIGLIIHRLASDKSATEDYISHTAIANVERIVLPDKSVVHLSKQSKMDYPQQFANDKRQVKLEGEAFFNVSDDKSRPFIIDAQFAQIKVVGTAFNVKAFKNKDIVEVDVESGIVELYHSKMQQGQPLVLKQGESGILKDSEFEAKKANKKDLFAKKIIFKDTKFIDVAKTLKHAYNVEIEFKNDKIKQYKLSIVMYNMDIDSVMSSLQAKYKDIVIKKVSDKKYTIDN